MAQIGSETTMNSKSIEENTQRITNNTIQLNALDFVGKL